MFGTPINTLRVFFVHSDILYWTLPGIFLTKSRQRLPKPKPVETFGNNVCFTPGELTGTPPLSMSL